MSIIKKIALGALIMISVTAPAAAGAGDYGSVGPQEDGASPVLVVTGAGGNVQSTAGGINATSQG